MLLLIDDDEAVLRSLQRILERAGYRVITRSSVREARDVLVSQPLDVVVSDYWMQDGTGAEIAAELQRIAGNTRLVFLTGDRVPQAHGAAVLQKPVRAAELLDAVKLFPKALSPSSV